MALATRCPHCNTTFRVASDQLKLRGGIVRCGTCSQVFDGNAALVDLDAVAKNVAPAEPALEPEAEPAPPIEATSSSRRRGPIARMNSGAMDPRLRGDDVEYVKPEPEAEPIPEPGADTRADEVESHSASAAFDDELAEPALEPEAEPAPPIEATSSSRRRGSIARMNSGAMDPRLRGDDVEYVKPEPDAEPEPEPSASAAFDDELAAIEADQAAPAPAPYVLDFDFSLDTLPGEVKSTPEPEPEPEPEAIELSLTDEEFHEPDPAHLDEIVEGEHPDDHDHDAEPDLEHGPLPLLRESASDAPAEPEVAGQTLPETDPDEPEFVRLAREKEGRARSRRIMMASGSVVLVLALLVQSILYFGNVLAASYPGLKPALVASCKVLRCKIELPAQIESLGMETGELETLPNGTLVLTTLLRNASGLTQAWPYIELELTDAADKPLLRRVFTPPQYLPPAVAPAKGFAARSEQPVKIYFELKQVKASGFHVAVFYP